MANITKKALAASVSTLLNKKPLDKITIKDITDECGVTRNTFYYHFRDIYDLCSWIFIEQAEEILSTYSDEESWECGFLAGLNYLYDNKKMIYNVYVSVSKNELSRYLYRVSEKYALQLVKLQAKDMKVSDEAKKTTADFYINAFAGCLLQWVEEGMDTEPEKLAALCNSIFKGTVRNALLSAEKVIEN